PDPPSNLVVEAFQLIDDQNGTLRLRWDHSPGDFLRYHVYRRNPDSSRTYLGGTPNNAFFVPNIQRIGSEESITIEVDTVGPQFTHSSTATTAFDWPELHTPTPSPTAFPTATPTAGPTDIEITLSMPGSSFGTGDTCGLDLEIVNPGPAQSADLYVLLAVFDAYWCYPSWKSLNDGIDFEPLTIAAGADETKVLLPVFQMPPVGPAGPFYFYGAMFEPATLNADTLVSNVDVVEFYLE
ncbi:MAG TPA: hypothetical protein PLV45_02805, partial [bacterium]|nr:hypothetical protein [bacterium]